MVTLRASVPSGALFLGWTGEGCSGIGGCTVSMTQSRSVTATFAPELYPVAVLKTGTGDGRVESAPGGLACGPSCRASFPLNTTVVLSATPAPGSVFAGWEGENCTGAETCTLSMTAARTVTARFETPQAPRPGLALYDDFATTALDARWLNLDLVREIRDGRVALTYRGGGVPGQYGVTLPLASPVSVQSVQADLRLNDFGAPATEAARMRIQANLYNDGTASVGATGDVRAHVYIRGGNEGVDIRYHVYRCTNDACSGRADVVPAAIVKATTLGAAHTLGIAWDGAEIAFNVDGVIHTVDPRSAVPVGSPSPTVPGKHFEANVGMPGAGGTGFVAGDVDNVVVNGEVYDDFDGAPFSGPRLAADRWASLEAVREIQGGRLVSKVAYAGSASARNFSSLANPQRVTAAALDLVVTDYESTGTFVQAAVLSGGFYNDGTSATDTDRTGDVGALLRVRSSNGGPLTVEFLADRCPDPACTTQQVFHADAFATINPGDVHNLFLEWDGSVFTYGITNSQLTRTFDPKPLHAPVKPSRAHSKHLRTWVSANTANADGYIAVAFDNLFVNADAVAPSRLAPAFAQVVPGGVVSAGVGLRGTGAGTISLTGIPADATVERAFLYWATWGQSPTATTPTLNGTAVPGVLIGQSEGFWGTAQAFAYRADVTTVVTGNGAYTVGGLPAGPLPPEDMNTSDTQGASLVVIYALAGTPAHAIVINDGAVTVSGNLRQFARSSFENFTAGSELAEASVTFVVGDGQPFTPEYAGVEGTLLATNPFSGGEGAYWDTRTYDISTALASGATHVDAVLSTANETLVWVAAVLSVPGTAAHLPLTVTLAGQGGAVVSTPAGIDCGSACTAAFPPDTHVLLTAAASTGNSFAGWSGACTGMTETCTVAMTEARTVTATFAAHYTLWVGIAGSGDGSVTGSPINCGAVCTATLASGTVVALTPLPSPGSTFREWRGACTGNGACEVTMSAARSVTAVFSKTFTDQPLAARTTVIKASHFAELRAAIDALRGRNDLAAFLWTEAITPGVAIKRVHLQEMRTAVSEAYLRAGRTAPTFTDATLSAGVTLIRASHLNELRTAVRSLE
jgi:hypothetical protein